MRATRLLALPVLALPLAWLACGGSNTGSGFAGGDDNGDGGTTTHFDGSGMTPPLGGNDAGVFGTGDGSPGTGSNCSAAAQLVYVLDDKGNLYSFDPSTTLYEDAGPPSPSTAFKKLGTPNCPWGKPPKSSGQPAGPNSMAVDRNAIAWIGDNAGLLFKVDTANASACTQTAFKAGQSGFGDFGMGFSTTTVGGTTDTLYVVDNESEIGAGDSKGLATIDLTSFALSPIGGFSGSQSGEDCELTGTGNATLYGFFFQASSTVNQISTSNASILSNANVPVNLNVNSMGSIAWAFSFWGGDFYLYTADTGNAPYTDVTRYRPSDGTSTVVLPQIGFNIVGAGVSTCAPTVLPPIH